MHCLLLGGLLRRRRCASCSLFFAAPIGCRNGAWRCSIYMEQALILNMSDDEHVRGGGLPGGAYWWAIFEPGRGGLEHSGNSKPSMSEGGGAGGGKRRNTYAAVRSLKAWLRAIKCSGHHPLA
jgi:hypothetical protein